MSELLSLYAQLQNQGISFYTWDLGEEKSATLEMGGRYGIFVDIDNLETEAEEKVVIAHEGGHAVTGATHKLSSPYDLIEKHEQLANRWAYQRLLPVEKLRYAMSAGYSEPWQLAEYFDVTEPFVIAALEYYTEACGVNFNQFG